MSDEPHVTIWLEATTVFHGADAAGARHWKMIVNVLKALGCSDVILRETERSAGSWHCHECIQDRRQAQPATPDGGEGR